MADDRAASRGPIRTLRGIREAWEWGSWAISVVSTLASVVRNVGGLVDFLVEVSVFGIACYVATIPVVAIMSLFFDAVKKLTGKDVNDVVGITILILGVLAGGFFLYSGFAVDPDEMDTFGRTFSALLGAAVLLTPAYFLWRRFGSKPQGRGRRAAAPPS